MATVRMQNVNKTIKGNPVLVDINLELSPGQIYGVCGRNASGKTMLLRAMAGLIRIDSGSVEIDHQRIGRDIAFPPSLGIIIENVELLKPLTGYENLELLASIRKKIGRAEIEATMERIGLVPSDSKRYGSYSLGMRQKVAIAQAIMEKPELLILDEPTNGLDESSVAMLYDVLRAEKARGVTCILASHQIADLVDLCDELFNMDNGCLRAYKVKA